MTGNSKCHASLWIHLVLSAFFFNRGCKGQKIPQAPQNVCIKARQKKREKEKERDFTSSKDCVILQYNNSILRFFLSVNFDFIIIAD